MIRKINRTSLLNTWMKVNEREQLYVNYIVRVFKRERYLRKIKVGDDIC